MNVYNANGQLVRIIHKVISDKLGPHPYRIIEDIKSSNCTVILKDGRTYKVELTEIK